MLDINSKAPNFSLLDQNGKECSLEDYKGKWILIYFYPKDNTPGCTTEACAIRDAWNIFSEKNIQVLGISKDSVESHQKFMADHKLPFTLLSDVDEKVISEYGAKGGVFNKRISYLINPQLEIVKIYLDVDPGIHVNEVILDFDNLFLN